MMEQRLYAAWSQKGAVLRRWQEAYHPNRRWILDLRTDWAIQAPSVPAFLIRNDALRAQASCNHELRNEIKSAASSIPVKIRSISPSGVTIESAIGTWVGELAILVIDRFEPTEGFVTWQRYDRCGFLFANEIDISSIIYRLKSATYKQLRKYSVEETRLTTRTNKVCEDIYQAPCASSASINEVEVERLLEDIAGYLDDGGQPEAPLIATRIARAIDARPKIPRHSASLMHGLAIALVATAAAFSAGVLQQGPPDNAPITDQVGKFVSIPLARSRLSPAAEPPNILAPTDRSIRVSDRVEIGRLPEPAARIRQRAEQHLPTTHSPATEFASDIEAAAYDPYAGRVAKRLSGTALESALAADRRATRELNLRQLRQVQADAAAIEVQKIGVRPAIEN